MFCKNCGTKIRENGGFCQNCSKATPATPNKISSTNIDVNPLDTKPIVTCGNCDYSGPGEPARSIAGQILAWICFPWVTIIYYAVTHKYRCPKCKSTSLTIKSNEGVTTKQKGGTNKTFKIVAWVLIGVAVIGVFATLLLLQLGVARERARDAKRIADVNQVRTAIELYFDDNGQYPQVTTYDALSSLLTPKYISSLPEDPLNLNPHIYSYAYSGETKYQVSAVLEQWAQGLGSDADIDSIAGGWTGETVDGSKDSQTDCTTPSTTTCIYDQGQN